VQIDFFQAVVLGMVQGITEFLPVSSHAHLILIPWLLGWPDPGITFDVALHLGTLLALLLYFWRDWIYLTMSSFRLLKGDIKDPDSRIAFYIILATIPGGIAGLLFEHLEDQISTPVIIATTLIGVAALLRAAEVHGRRRSDLGTMTLGDALTIGFAQALAIIPGVSRSGVTITAGLFRGMRRDAAATFSFLLSAPIVAGAVAKKMIDIARNGLPADQQLPFVAGTLVAAFVGFICIAALIRYLKHNTTFVFINYRIAVGIIVLVLHYFWNMH
jgi:undecaprenyl-diphosphatase